MQLRMVLPIALFVAGIGSIAASVVTGESEASLVLIFPVISGSGPLLLLGIVLMFASFLVGFLMMVSAAERAGTVGPADDVPNTGAGAPKTKTSYGGVVLVGPVPIAFGSDMKIAKIMLVIGIILAVVLVVALLLL